MRSIRQYFLKYRSNVAEVDDYLFISASGAKLTENAIKKMFTKLSKASEVKRLHCHSGRHTFVTNYIIDGHTSQELRIKLRSKLYIIEAIKRTLDAKQCQSNLVKKNLHLVLLLLKCDAIIF